MLLLTGLNQIEAETAAGRLRVDGIRTIVQREEDALLGVLGASSLGTYSVAIPDADEAAARAALDLKDPNKIEPRSTQKDPLSAGAIMFVVVALLVGYMVLSSWSFVFE